MASDLVGTIIFIGSWALIIGGVASIFFPIVPAVPIIWMGIFVYGLQHDFLNSGRTFLMVVTAVALGSIVLDYTLGRYGLQKFRLSIWAIFGALVGIAVGWFFNPIIAYLVGPVVGAIIGETLHGHDQVFSYRTQHYTVVGFMGGTVIKFLAAIIMIGLFVLRIQGRV